MNIKENTHLIFAEHSNKLLKFDFTLPDKASQLKQYIGIEDSTESFMTDNAVTLWFIMHKVPKRSSNNQGQYRIVWEPVNGAERLYKTFSRRFELFLRNTKIDYPAPCSYGYSRGRNTLGNASLHVGAPFILHADIKDFFPSISKDRLFRAFCDLSINQQVAEFLSRFATINDALPLGVHSSPMLANLCCLNLDAKLSNLSKIYSSTYSRYADDLTISGKNIPSRSEVEEILLEEGFCLSERKFRITKPGQNHFVTGLSVSDVSVPHVPRKLKRKLRQELYYCEKFGIQNNIVRMYNGLATPRQIRNAINRIDGMVRYVSYVEKYAFPDLAKKWKKLLHDEGVCVTYPKNDEERLDREVVIYVDETDFVVDGRRYLAISFAQTENSELLESETKRILELYMREPFSAGRMNNLETFRLHFSTVHPDLALRYIERLSTFVFDGYIAFCELDRFESFQRAYLFLISKMLPDRLRFANKRSVRIIFEQNTQVKQTTIDGLVEKISQDLKNRNDKHPSSTKCIKGSKTEFYGISAADFILGVTRKYALINEKQSENNKDKLNFERLRDKIRYIYDARLNVKYTRHRPFLPLTYNTPGNSGRVENCEIR